MIWIVGKLNKAIHSNTVSLVGGCKKYPQRSPYSPNEAYPEYPFNGCQLGTEANDAYRGVRDSFKLLGLDEERFGQVDWNPLGEMIQPGQTVVLKPNFVREYRETHIGHGDCLITHGPMIRATLDYVYLALKGNGRIIVADAPQNDADFNAIKRIAGLEEIQEFYRETVGFDVEVYDLRPEQAKKVDGVIIGHESLPGDPEGYVKVDLRQMSMFSEVEHLCHLLYGSEYDTSEIRSHHTNGTHEYMISKTILNADCIINLPKLKTHKKTGITICLKNLVGINGNKNWLPHHREGTPTQGGDQYKDNGIIHRVEKQSMELFRKVFPLLGPLRKVLAQPIKSFGKCVFGDTNKDTVRSGNWHGNDTTWRMVIDLNRILLYANSDGGLSTKPVRQIFCVVDAVVSGEGNGPLDPVPKHTSVILAGVNPVAVDNVCVHLMGFDRRKVPLAIQSLVSHQYPIIANAGKDITILYDDKPEGQKLVEYDGPVFRFKPHFGWVNYIERDVK